MLRLQARLNFCGREITEDDMIYKTLSTFPTSAFILEDQYRLEYDNKRITTFNKLISLLQVAERHNELLLDNNTRPTGTKKIPEANYGKMKGEKNSNAKGFGRVDPYPRGNNAPRGKGRGGGGNKVQMAPKNPSIKQDIVGNEPCYRCGVIGHWYKNCQASNIVAATYKRYRESKAQEAHYMEKEGHDLDVNLTIADFNGNEELAQSMDALNLD
ncbi:hypothetical protein ABKV19_008342 [Rosa sericea]